MRSQLLSEQWHDEPEQLLSCRLVWQLCVLASVAWKLWEFWSCSQRLHAHRLACLLRQRWTVREALLALSSQPASLVWL